MGRGQFRWRFGGTIAKVMWVGKWKSLAPHSAMAHVGALIDKVTLKFTRQDKKRDSGKTRDSEFARQISNHIKAGDQPVAALG